MRRPRVCVPVRWFFFLSLLLALALPASVLASAIVVNTPVGPQPETNPCNGDVAITEGTFHAEHNMTITGQTFHDTINTSTHLTGTTATGARYVGSTDTTDELTGPLAFEETHDITVLMVRQGETGSPDDFYQRVRVHQTINAQGQPTADVTLTDTTCH